jgi:hypothetical protein
LLLITEDFEQACLDPACLVIAGAKNLPNGSAFPPMRQASKARSSIESTIFVERPDFQYWQGARIQAAEQMMSPE